MRSKRPPLPPAKPSADRTQLRLLCSCGGRIMAQPRGNRFRYVGGESRFIVVDKTISLHSLFNSLAVVCLSVLGRRRPFAAKYQLPGIGLDTLITLATKEDLENMIAEYDRTIFPHSPCLRLFLFPIKNSPPSSRSGHRVANSSKRSDSLTSANRFMGLDSPEIPSPSSTSTYSSASSCLPNASPEIHRRQEDYSPNAVSSTPEKTGVMVSSDQREKVATFEANSSVLSSHNQSDH